MAFIAHAPKSLRSSAACTGNNYHIVYFTHNFCLLNVILTHRARLINLELFHSVVPAIVTLGILSKLAFLCHTDGINSVKKAD